MNFAARFYPGDDTVRLAVSVLLQITWFVILATAASRILARRNAALRDGIWRATLVLVCAAPLLAWGCDRAGINVWQPSSGDVGRRSQHHEDFDASARDASSLSARVAREALIADHPIPITNVTTAAQPTSIPARGVSDNSLNEPNRLRTAIGAFTAIWAAVAVALVIRLTIGLRVVARLRRESKPFADLPRSVAERLRKTLGVAQLPPIMHCERIGGPATVGIWRPVVVLPTGLLSNMTAVALHDALAHECAHALRRDALMALVQQIVAVAYWVHPLVYVLNRQLSRAREEVCDNVVLASTSATDYARTLLALSQAVQSSRGRLAVIPMFDRRWRLARRVAGILNTRRIIMARMNKFAAAVVVVVALSAGITLAAICSAADPPKKGQSKTATSGGDSSNPQSATAANDGATRKTSTVTEPKTISISGAAGANPAASGEPPEVPVSRVVEREVTDFEDFTGSIVAPESVKIIPRVTGYLISTSFKEGAEVKKGDKLFEIDPRPFQAELDQAEAELRVAETRLKVAEAEFERFKELLKRSAISQEDYKKAEATLQEAQAAMAAARASVEGRNLTLSFCTIMSPIDGHAGGYNVTPGNLVKQDDTVLTTIVSHDSIGVSFEVDERTWLRMAKMPREPSTKVLVRADDETGFEHKGVVNFFANEFNRTTGTIAARAIIANPPLKSGAKLFIPGMHVTVRMMIGQPHKALLVSNEAIVATAEGPIVFVVDNDGLLEARLVKQGQLQDDGLRVIRNGLKPNEEVAIKPGVNLPGNKIRPNLVPMPTAHSDESKAEK
jgi:RND family efflux transporter MFP subunit